jgi:hypothetical protein
VAFPPERNHKVPLETAAKLTAHYRESAPKGSQAGCMFPRDVFERLLAQPGCAGIRIYWGRSEMRERETVLVAVDEEANDMTDGELFDWGYPCPPFCGGGSVLGGEQT